MAVLMLDRWAAWILLSAGLLLQPGAARQQKVTRDDLISVMPTNTDHIDLALASRSWRQVD